jgi:peptidoglycan hydrolase-like protein with peptidoglycan-binding domain
MLSSKGFNPGGADGDFGPRTRAAVVAFQRSRGLSADSVVGPNTSRALFGSSDRKYYDGVSDFQGPGPVSSGGGASNTQRRLAENARAVAMSMGGYRSQGLCATGVSRTIARTMGLSVGGNGNQIDNNLPRSRFRQVNMSLEQALRTPGLILTWERTSTRLGSIYGHTAVTLGDGHSSASDFIESNTLAAQSGRSGLKIFQPI